MAPGCGSAGAAMAKPARAEMKKRVSFIADGEFGKSEVFVFVYMCSVEGVSLCVVGRRDWRFGE